MSAESINQDDSPKYVWGVPPSLEEFIDIAVGKLPEDKRWGVGRDIAYAFHVGFTGEGLDPDWQRSTTEITAASQKQSPDDRVNLVSTYTARRRRGPARGLWLELLRDRDAEASAED